ncbi:hypothetical protein [Streptomyces sp. NPDC002550]
MSVRAQTRPAVAASRAREAASALFAGVFNTAVALGALTGGRLADGPGLTVVLVTGAVLALPAAVGDAKGAATPR